MDSKKTAPLIDFQINVKLKLAGFWTAATFCYLYGDYFELYTPEKVNSLISGDNILGNPLFLFIASVMMAIPPLMIIISLTLKPSINKWLNIVFGLFFTLIMLFIAVASFTPWYSFYVFLAIVEAILTALVVWNAIKWPRKQEV